MDGSQTNRAERVGVVDGAPSAAADQGPEAPRILTLKQRLAAIRDECFGIGKSDIQMESAKGAKFTIKGHTFEAVLSEVRPLLRKHGVDITPNLVERTYTGNRCDVLIDFEFERTDDSDERRVIRWAGAGTDNGDKGFSKAGTNAVKEMLKKRFLITDRDDAKEEEEKVEHRAEGGVSRDELEKAKEQRRDAVEKWAKAHKSAIENARDLRDIKRLEAEQAAQFATGDLPEVTAQFFEKLIRDRKEALTPKADGE